MAYPWSAHDILTASDLNAAIGTGIVSTGLGAWTSYTPTWSSTGTGPAIGNGSIAGAYIKIGRLVIFKILMVAGSTSTYGTGIYTWTMPDTADTAFSNMWTGGCVIRDASPATFYFRHLVITGGTTFQAYSEAGTAVGPTSPMTWTTSDRIQIQGVYESTT